MEHTAVVTLMFLFAASCSAMVARSNSKLNVPALFIFGDSLLDSGTNNYINNSAFKANFRPYGQDFFHKPTGRFSNGRHIGDFLAQFLRVKMPRPFLSGVHGFKAGVNFASAGSGILDSTNQDKGTISLNNQLQQFIQVRHKLVEKHGVLETNKLLSESVYLITIGSNDLLENYLVDSQKVPPEQFIALMVQGYAASIQTLYGYGARKIVVFGLGPLGCTPSVLVAANATYGACVSGPNELAVGFNGGLQQALEGLRSNLHGSTILYANPFDKFSELIKANLQRDGVVKACCGAGALNAVVRCGRSAGGETFTVCSEPSEFVFWDFIHPTENSYRIFSELFWSGDQKDIFPMNISSLAAL